MEAIQQEKEIDKVMLRQGSRGDLFQQLFTLIRQREIPFQFVPEEAFKAFADRNHQGVLAEIAPVPYRDFEEVLDEVEMKGRVPFVLILDRVTDVRNFGAIVQRGVCGGGCRGDSQQEFGEDFFRCAEDIGWRVVSCAGVPGAEPEKGGA